MFGNGAVRWQTRAPNGAAIKRKSKSQICTLTGKTGRSMPASHHQESRAPYRSRFRHGPTFALVLTLEGEPGQRSVANAMPRQRLHPTGAGGGAGTQHSLSGARATWRWDVQSDVGLLFSVLPA